MPALRTSPGLAGSCSPGFAV